MAADPKRLWLPTRVSDTIGGHFGNKNNSCFSTLAPCVGLNHPPRGSPSMGNQNLLIVSGLLASVQRGRFESSLNCRGERWPALLWEDNEPNVSGLLCCHLMGAFHCAWTTDVAGYHDTLVARQRGHHKQIPHSRNESLSILSLPPFFTLDTGQTK